MLRSRLPKQAARVSSTLSTDTATALYQQGMLSAATRDSARWEAETIRERMKVAQEFCTFLSALPQAGQWGLTMDTAGPIDVIVFSETVPALHPKPVSVHLSGQILTTFADCQMLVLPCYDLCLDLVQKTWSVQNLIRIHFPLRAVCLERCVNVFF